MKILFSRKNKKCITNLSSAESAHSVVSVKYYEQSDRSFSRSLLLLYRPSKLNCRLLPINIKYPLKENATLI